MASKSQTISIPWSDLQAELLSHIANRLPTRLDVVHFRGVCHAWRHSVPLPSPPKHRSLKLPFPISRNSGLNPRRKGYFRVVQSSLYCVEPTNTNRVPFDETKAWLIKVREQEQPGKMLLIEPFSRFPVKPLPGKFPKVLNLLDNRFRVVGSIYGLEFSQKLEEIDMDVDHELKSFWTNRVELCESEGGIAVMAMHTVDKLHIWREGDKKWSTVRDGRQSSNYVDITCHKARFYAVDCNGLTIAVDPFTKKVVKITPASPPWGPIRYGMSMYLVKANGDLFLVKKVLNMDQYLRSSCNLCDCDSDDEIDYPVDVAVYKLDEEKSMWVSVKDIGHFAFFVGEDGSSSVSTEEFRGCSKNTIYCTEDSISRASGREDFYTGWNVGIYDLEEGRALTLSSLPHGGSKIFWPPPKWLKPVPGASKN